MSTHFLHHDWYELVLEDKNKLGLSLTDNQISTMSKAKFKTIVALAVRKYALNCLNQTATKTSKCSKLAEIVLAKENYLSDKRFTKSECELLFALRTRMIPGIRANFSSQYGNNLICELCSEYPCTQEHLLSCAILITHVNIPDNVEYEDLYRSVEEQLKVVKVFKQILRVREILICV